ncbi:hypothetical protein [Pseudomonas edaphica]|uniref:hypothetical protein n=1 Tax=Pseudomonas edaphica TaxID=2006980 RepID=UPI003D0F32DE
MNRIFTIALALSAIAHSALAAEVAQPEPKLVTNLHDNQGIHEDLIASQELIALGCMGKLNITATASGYYDAASLAKIQQCADNEGTDLAAKLLAQYKRGEIEKARMPTYTLHYSAIFAKENNIEAGKTATADLIKAAREQGKKHYPYTGK